MYDESEAARRQPHHVEDGPLADQGQDEGEHAELAGEMSGHMFFADRYYGFDDALYAACRLMEIVANSGRPLSRATGRPAEDRDHAGDPLRLSGRD